MTPLRIFISSVQKEFSHEREALRDYLREDPLMRRFFDVFLFEDTPASDRRPDELYLDEVERCDVYVGCSAVITEPRMRKVCHQRSGSSTARPPSARIA